MFEATRGTSVRSDIAIDDIVLKSGPCQGKLPLPIHTLYIKSPDYFNGMFPFRPGDHRHCGNLQHDRVGGMRAAGYALTS